VLGQSGDAGLLDPHLGTGAKSCSCVPAFVSYSQPFDSCSGVGRACDVSAFDPTTLSALACRAPREQESCTLNGGTACEGAAGGVSCQSVDDSAGQRSLCLRGCTSTSQCPALDQKCVQLGTP